MYITCLQRCTDSVNRCEMKHVVALSPLAVLSIMSTTQEFSVAKISVTQMFTFLVKIRIG